MVLIFHVLNNVVYLISLDVIVKKIIKYIVKRYYHFNVIINNKILRFFADSLKRPLL